MSLAQIRETRAAKVADMRRLLSVAETEKRSLNANEQTQFDGLKTEITGLEQSEARTLFLEDAERRSMGTPVGDKHATSLERSVNVVEVIRAIIKAKPSACKGVYLKSCCMSSTMGPGVRLDVASLASQLS